MKFNLSTIQRLNQHYGCTGEVAPDGVDALVAKIGAQLGSVDEVIHLGDKYRGIVIVKIVSCQPHPDADKLQLCTIDDGGNTPAVKRSDDGYVQVVCGAPNARAGLTVAWLPPGATVPATFDKEPFVLEAREIRGQLSNGMLASPRELALGDSHDGILEIDGDHQPGTDFAEAFYLNDVLIDIENKMFTHRPDLFGFLGIARELAGIQDMAFKSPDWYTPAPEFPSPETAQLPLTVKNELPQLVPRFSAIVLANVQVGPSPMWLQTELAKLGQKSINNIVDYTNFYMQETGQPLHAYDYDKVKNLSGDEATITVRYPQPDETIKLLNGKEVAPRAEAIMIATDRQAIGIGGVMGGSETEVDLDTKNIIIECAIFDMYSIRRTSMAHGLFTDAVTRFSKGQSPLQNLAVLAKITDEIREHAGGQVASPVIDDRHLDDARPPLKVSADFINARLGLQLSAEQIAGLLENVEFTSANGDELTITAPFWRTDIELPEDIVEEVGRLYGYDKLPLTLPRRDLTPAARNQLFDLKAAVRARLSKAGANEILTYSFVPGSLLDKVGQDRSKAFEVANALSPDLQYYRLSLIPSLLEKVHPNIKAGYDEFALFELGKTHDLEHTDDNGLPAEFEFTALVVAGSDKLKKPGAPYYQARAFLEALAGVEPTFKPIDEKMRHYPVVQPYDLSRSAFASLPDGTFLGIIGEFKPAVRRALKLPTYAAGFEVDTTALQALLTAGPVYKPLSRFPKVTQDITLKVATSVNHQEIVSFFWGEYENDTSLGRVESTLSTRDIYQAVNDDDSRNVTLRFTITSYDRTLTDGEVNRLLDTIAAAAKAKFGAERL